MAELSSFSGPIKAVVVGATGGLGSAFVENLLESGKVDVLYALSRSGVAHRDERVKPHRIDFSDETTIAVAAEQIPAGLDLVICATGLLHANEENGGIAPEKTWRTFNQENAAQVFLANAFGPMLIMKHFAPKLARDRKAVIASLSARVGSISDNELGGWYSYRAAKAALNQFIKCTAIELARKNENAICIGLHPGTVDTGLSKPFQSNVGDGKLFPPDFSAKSMLSVIEERSATDTGALFAWDGQEIMP